MRRAGGRTLRDWEAYVQKSPDVPLWVKRVLLAFAEKPRGNRMMSRPCREVAAQLDMSPRAVLKAIQMAKKAGLLIVVRRGVQGHTAEYQGMFGTPETMRELGEPPSPEMAKSEEVHPNDHSQFLGSPHKYPTTQTETIFEHPQEREEVAANREIATPSRAADAPSFSLFSPSLCWTCGGALSGAVGWCASPAHREHGSMHAAMVLVAEELGGVDMTAMYADA